MKAASTIRRELRRLEGMRKRETCTPEQRAVLWHKIQSLHWAMESQRPCPRWARPSDTGLGLQPRKGDK